MQYKNAIDELRALFSCIPTILYSFFKQWKKNLRLHKHETLEEIIANVERETGKKRFNLVGHSFGGLSALIYTMENPEKVHNCVTIGMPVKGTPTAYLSILLLQIGLFPMAAKQMLPNSKFVKAVNAYFSAHSTFFENAGVEFLNIRSLHDELVPPKYSSLKELSPYSRNISEITYSGLGHVGLLFNKDVQKRIIRVCSELPTIFLHGFGMEEKLFGDITESMTKKFPEARRGHFFYFSYDYTKPIKAEKILRWYENKI